MSCLSQLESVHPHCMKAQAVQTMMENDKHFQVDVDCVHCLEGALHLKSAIGAISYQLLQQQQQQLAISC